MVTTVTSTIKSSGGDYTTLSAWEAAKQGDLVTADQVQVAECYTFSGGLVDNVTIDGSTTDATRYMKITVAAGNRHTGIPQTGFYIKKSVASFGSIVSLADPYAKLEYVDVENTAAASGNGIKWLAGGTNTVADKCISKVGTGSSCAGFELAGITPVNTYNCLVYGGNTGFLASSTGASIYNCVAANCTTGFSATGFPVVKNSVAYTNTTNWGGGQYSGSCTNNATSSASDDAPGASSVINVASGNFVNAASNDFHLASGTNSLVGAGVDLSATFTTDIDGDTWGATWDIGFDYRVSAGGVTAALTGQGITVAQGSLSAAVESALTGQAIAIAQGTVTVESGVTAALTGQAVTVAQGSVLSDVSASLTGQAIPIAQGTVVVDVSQAITGQGLTLAIGSTIAAIEAPLTGQAVSLAQGDVGVGGDIVRALTGQSITVAQGVVSIFAETAATGGGGGIGRGGKKAKYKTKKQHVWLVEIDDKEYEVDDLEEIHPIVAKKLAKGKVPEVKAKPIVDSPRQVAEVYTQQAWLTQYVPIPTYEKRMNFVDILPYIIAMQEMEEEDEELLLLLAA